MMGWILAVQPWPESLRTTAIAWLSCASSEDGDHLSTALRAEFFYDDEAHNWHYRVPALHINGGGTETREEAESECMSAIAFALEGDPHEYDGSAEAVTFDVSVSPAA
jgi:hypothetical protein